jgi:hypothetical protein
MAFPRRQFLHVDAPQLDMFIICPIGIGGWKNYALDISLQGRIVTVRWRPARNMIRERAPCA